MIAPDESAYKLNEAIHAIEVRLEEMDPSQDRQAIEELNSLREIYYGYLDCKNDLEIR